jgi:3,4-dihydroxy-2-butanone 4-phosphate synthase
MSVLDKIKGVASRLTKGEVIVIKDEKNERGFLMSLAQYTTAEQINFMTKYGKGLTYVPLTQQVAQRLNLHLMTRQFGSAYYDRWLVSVDVKSSGTGISAFDRAETIRRLANPASVEDDFRKPGHVFPLLALNSNHQLKENDWASLSVVLAEYCHVHPVTHMTEILNEKGARATLEELEDLEKNFNLTSVTTKDLLLYHQHILQQTSFLPGGGRKHKVGSMLN